MTSFKDAITSFNSLNIEYKDNQSTFNPPRMNNAQQKALSNIANPISAKPEDNVTEGTIIFNTEAKVLQVFQGGKWVDIKGGGDGSGDVVGPINSEKGNIAVFNGTNGKTLKDGGVPVSAIQIPQTKNQNADTLYQISNLGALQFGNSTSTDTTGAILLDSLSPVTFQTHGTGANTQVTSVISSDLPAGSSSSSASLEINSTTGCLLHARMTTAQRDALVDPQDGMEIFNTDTKQLNIRANGVWRPLGESTTSPAKNVKVYKEGVNILFYPTTDSCKVTLIGCGGKGGSGVNDVTGSGGGGGRNFDAIFV